MSLQVRFITDAYLRISTAIQATVRKLSQSELEILLWSYLDLDESEQGAIVLEMLEQESSDSEDHHARRGRAVAARVDEYIQDAAEGYHGGVGYKV